MRNDHETQFSRDEMDELGLLAVVVIVVLIAACVVFGKLMSLL